MIWRDAVAFLARAWNVAIEDGDWCGLRVPMEGRPRRVALKLACNEPSIIVTAQVCAERHLEARRALEYNNAVEHWSLALEQKVYVLRRTLPLSSLTEPELDAAVRIAASEAARLERLHVAVAPSPLPSFGCPLSHWWA